MFTCVSVSHPLLSRDTWLRWWGKEDSAETQQKSWGLVGCDWAEGAPATQQPGPQLFLPWRKSSFYRSLERSSLSLQSSSIKTLQDGEAAAANSCTHCSVIGKEHSCTLSTLHADQNIVCRPDKGCFFFFFSILQSLTRGKLCHSHGSETLESLTWPCLCQAIYIHSGIYLILHIHSLAPHTW